MQSFLRFSLSLGLLTLMGACHLPKGKTSFLKRAVANDGPKTQLIKVPNVSGGTDLVLQTFDYQTTPATPIGYKIVCSVPTELDKLLTGIGIDPRVVTTLTKAYDDPDTIPAPYAALNWTAHPELRCPADRNPGATGDQLGLRRSQQTDKTFFYLQVKASPNQNKTRNLYELGCKGLVEGLGFTLQEAEIVDPQSYIQGSQGKIYDINCSSGQPADLIPFVAECEKAQNASVSDDRDDAYNRLMVHMQDHGFAGSTCTELWNHLKPMTTLDISGLQVSSLAPLRYLTRLTTLNARDNFITDLSPLANVANLQDIDLGINPDLKNLTPLGSLRSLRSLKLDETITQDLAGLLPLKKLATLDVSRSGVRLPNLEALKTLRIETLKVDGLNLTWKPNEQTFFTNCLVLNAMPAIERSSFSNILQAFGATINQQNQVTPSCFALYRDVSSASGWPELDLSPYMSFPVSAGSPPVTACLKPNVLATLNDLPAKVKLDYEGCRLTDADLVSILKVQRLSALDLKQTGLTNLAPLAAYPGLGSLALEIGGFSVTESLCPIDSSNEALNNFCRGQRVLSITALQSQFITGNNLNNLALAKPVNGSAAGLTFSLTENGCGTWFMMDAAARVSGTWPVTMDRCQVKMVASIQEVRSNEVSISLVKGSPTLTVIPDFFVGRSFNQVKVATVSAVDATIVNTLNVVKNTCAPWLTVSPDGTVAGAFPGHPMPVTVCNLELTASNPYGVTAIGLVKITNSTPTLAGLTQYTVPWNLGSIEIAKAKSTDTSAPATVVVTGRSCPASISISPEGLAQGIWDQPGLSCTLDLTARSSYGDSDPLRVTLNLQPMALPNRMSGTDSICAVSSQQKGKCWTTGVHPWGEENYQLKLTLENFDAGQKLIQFSKPSYLLGCGLLEDGRVSCNGFIYRPLPNGGSITERIDAPKIIDGFSGIIQLAVGSEHACGLRADHRVLCWGKNDFGQAGASAPGIAALGAPTVVPNFDKVTFLVAGHNSTCAIKEDGSAWCWGNNEMGKLGNGNTSHQSIPQRVQLVGKADSLHVGSRHACAVLKDKTVQCWGENRYGQLGNNSTTAASIPVIAQNVSQVKMVVAGGNNTCIVNQSGDVYCWGDNNEGQMGNGTTLTTPVWQPTRASVYSVVGLSISGSDLLCAATSDLVLRCWGVITTDDDMYMPQDKRITPVPISNL